MNVVEGREDDVRVSDNLVHLNRSIVKITSQ